VDFCEKLLLQALGIDKKIFVWQSSGFFGAREWEVTELKNASFERGNYRLKRFTNLLSSHSWHKNVFSDEYKRGCIASFESCSLSPIF
jgi:hypothetical protein